MLRRVPGLELGLADALHGLSRPDDEWNPISSRPALRWNRLARLTTRAEVWVRTFTGPKGSHSLHQMACD